MMELKNSVQIVNFISCFILIHNIYVYNCEEFVVRRTNYGNVRGIIELVHSGKKVETYYGIPYAKPPIGNRRFEPPEPVESWGDGVLNAIELPPACPQSIKGLKFIGNDVPGFNKTNEDCLYLNIHVPRNYQDHRRIMPVLFFVHGGSYYSGMGASFDGRSLASENIVVVTMNYRLGPLGFLDAGDSHFSGNYGMLDQVAALKWVKENIEFFNGDPNQVALDGQSAGGCSVGLLMMSPLTQGMFRRVIMQSGSTLAHWAVTRNRKGPDIYFKAFATEMGCLFNSTLRTKACLKQIDGERIQSLVRNDFGLSPSLSPSFRPVVDGYFLPDTPEKLLNEGKFEVESVLIGSTKDEGLAAVLTMLDSICGAKTSGTQRLLSLMFCFKADLPNIPDIIDLVIGQYTDWPFHASETNTIRVLSEMVGDYYITAPTQLMAQRLSFRNTSVYIYNFEYKSVFDQVEGVIHGADMNYLSGYPLIGHENFRFDDSDKKMSKMMLHLWSSFTKDGLPSLIPHKEFYIDRYTTAKPVYARIMPGPRHPQIMMEISLKPHKMSFWNAKITALKEKHCGRDVKTNDDHYTTSYVVNSPNSWALIAACIGLSVLTVSFSVGYFRTRRTINKLIRQNGLPVNNRII